MPTLLIADDHPLFRAAIIGLLRERFAPFQTLEAASAATLGQALQDHPEVELVLLAGARRSATRSRASPCSCSWSPALPVAIDQGMLQYISGQSNQGTGRTS